MLLGHAAYRRFITTGMDSAEPKSAAAKPITKIDLVGALAAPNPGVNALSLKIKR
jgi:hypothetical protein